MAATLLLMIKMTGQAETMGGKIGSFIQGLRRTKLSAKDKKKYELFISVRKLKNEFAYRSN